MKQRELKTKEVRVKLDKALEKFAKENGLDSLSVGNMTYGEEGFSTRLKGKFELENKEKEVLFNRKAILMGLRENLYLKELDVRGEKFTIVDINTNAPVNSIIAEKEDGSRYRFKSESFKK